MRKLLYITALALTETAAMANTQTQQDTIEWVSKMLELKEVVVRGDLPNTRLKGNAMITRIDGTPLAKSGTADELLLKVPGMTGNEDKLEVIGKGEPLIYLNGRLLRDAGELKRLRSEDIRDVEVINNPGARYNATVKAVVRIRTKRQKGDGFSLDLTATDEQDLRYGFNMPRGKVGVNYRTNGIDVFASAYYFHQDFRQYSTLKEITTTPGRTFCQDGPYTMTWYHNDITYTAGTNWQISDSHSVGVRADLMQYFDGKNKVIYDEDVYIDNNKTDHLYSDQTNRETKPLGILTNAYYNGTAGKLGIDLNVDFMRTQTNTDRYNVETSLLNNDYILSKSGTKSRLYAAKLVLSYPVWKGSLEAGTEMTFVRRHNSYWIDKPSIPDTDADIKEDNIAAFAEYGCDFGKAGSASIGMRYEHTLFDYDDARANDFLHRPQDEFFPTASYSVSLGKIQAALAYSLKTSRPSFFAMNDAVTYISRYSLQAGNSQLLNERMRDLTLNLSWKWLTLSASYERSKNAITQWSFLRDNDVALVKHINLAEPYDNYSTYISATPRIGIWSLNATAGIDKPHLSMTLDDGRRQSFNKPTYTVNAFNTISLKHGWQFDLNLMFQSRGQDMNFYNNYDKIRLGIVAQKTLLKDKSLTIRAAVLDVLQRSGMNEYGDMGYYQIWQTNKYSRHKLHLSLFYRLNSARSKYKGTGAGKDAQNRMKS
ncbi:MAG: TonB-dependent receptor family protein [Bacteroidaceae bacterium]|nr:TonB-dependent receptor family protein [Bacteroidaceae bacterium]